MFLLHPNFPNPFNPSTTLKYSLPYRAHVYIAIYDILGKNIYTLENGIHSPGVKSVIWNGKDNFGRPASAGIYLYKIQAGDFVQTRKMVLLK
jgi:flagellar hook assembly protein FlgD